MYKFKNKFLGIGLIVLIGFLFTFVSIQSTSGDYYTYDVSVRVSRVVVVDDGDSPNWWGGCNSGEFDLWFKLDNGPDVRDDIGDFCSFSERNLSVSQSPYFTYSGGLHNSILQIRLTDKDGSSYNNILVITLKILGDYSGTIVGINDYNGYGPGRGGNGIGTITYWGSNQYHTVSSLEASPPWDYITNGFNLEVNIDQSFVSCNPYC